MKRFGTAFLFASLAFFLSASAFQASARPVSPAVKQGGTASTLEINKSWQQEWDSLLAAAKAEGKLMVYSTMGPSVRQALKDGFGKKYGINFDVLIGRGGELSQKIISEHRAGMPIADILHGGSSDMIGSLKPAGLLDAMEPAFILPDVKDPEVIRKTWWGGELIWVDKARTIFVTFVQAPANLALNTTLVKPEDIKSYRDLLLPKWKGKIILHDPTVSGAGQKWFTVIGSRIMGWDYIRSLAKQNPAVVRDARLQVEWLARGKYPILIAPKAPVFQEFKKAGAPIWRGTPVEGGYTTGAGGTLALVKDRPHPNAAKLFVNWLATKEGQTVLSKGYGLPSARLDVPTEEVDPATIPKPGVKYLRSDSEDFLNEERGFIKLADEIFGARVLK